MHALEWILCLSALLGALGLLIHAMNNHETKWNQTQHAWDENKTILGCSAEWDRANSHYVIKPTQNCTRFSFAIHNADGIFSIMGMDGNHYE